MAQNPYLAPPMGMATQNPEVRSLRGLLTAVRIIVLIIAAVVLLAFVGVLIFVAWIGTVGVVGLPNGFGFTFFLLPLGLVFIVALFAYSQIGEIRNMVDAGRYREAKEKTLLWMILGFLFGGVVIGLLLLFAYIKFDDVLSWERQMQGAAPPSGWAPPAAPGSPMGTSSPGAAPPAPVAPLSPPVATCPRCGRPATWIAQYNRWYCYPDQSYL